MNFLVRIYNRIRINYTFFLKLDKDNSKFVVSNYIPESLILDIRKISIRHSNRIENREIVSALFIAGYNYIGIHDDFKFKFLLKIFLRLFDKKINVVIYQNASILNFIKNISYKKVIYVATGCYYKHQNSMVVNLTNSFNKKYSLSVPYYRLQNEIDIYEDVYKILTIGSNETISTYPERFRNKMLKLGTIGLINNKFDLESKRQKVSKNHFIWIGSEGTLLRRLDLCIEFFNHNPNLTLHVVGHIDEDLKSPLKKMSAENIKFYGYLSLDSDKLLEIVNLSQWVINLSSSEGIPGSLINMMRMGCIPIFSRYSNYSDNSKIGILIKRVTISNLSKSIGKFLDFKTKQLDQIMLETYSLSNHLFGVDKFKQNIVNIVIDELI